MRLLATAKLLGLHQIPDEPQLLQLAAFVRRQFPDLTEAELTHAVERWAAGTLAPELRLFGTLSLDWLGGVLSAYRQDRLEHLRSDAAEQRRLQEAEQPAPAPIPDAFHDGLVRAYAAEHGALPFIADWDACWRHLRTTDQLPNLDGDARLAFEQQARAALDAERNDRRLAGRDLGELPDPTDAARWHAHLRAYRAKQYYQFTLNLKN